MLIIPVRVLDSSILSFYILTCLEDDFLFSTCHRKMLSDLPLLYIENQHLFLQNNCAIFIPGTWLQEQINKVIFHLKFILSLTLMLIFVLSWALRKRSDGSQMYPLCLGNSRQHIPICAKIISFLIKVLGKDSFRCCKTHISWYSPSCCSVCGFCSQCFSGVHPAGRWLSQNFYLS